jgi:hypothetical protein
MDFRKDLFGQMKVWPMQFDMEPSSRLRMLISANAAEATDPIVGYQIGIFGTREEAL